MTKTDVKNFRNDFESVIVGLQKKYGVNIKAGTIRYTDNELRFKVTASKGKVLKKLSKDDLQVGDIVSINHKKVSSDKRFKVIKVMTKNIKVEDINGYQQYTVSPNLLKKV